MEEAQAIADGHKKWIVKFLKEKPNHTALLKELFEKGEEEHCDSLSALLLSLKRAKVISYEGLFVSDQTPNIEITLINPEWTPNALTSTPVNKLV